MEFLRSLRLLIVGVVRNSYTIIPSLIADPFDWADRLGVVYEPPGYFVWVLFGSGLFLAIALAYHGARDTRNRIVVKMSHPPFSVSDVKLFVEAQSGVGKISAQALAEDDSGFVYRFPLAWDEVGTQELEVWPGREGTLDVGRAETERFDGIGSHRVDFHRFTKDGPKRDASMGHTIEGRASEGPARLLVTISGDPPIKGRSKWQYLIAPPLGTMMNRVLVDEAPEPPPLIKRFSMNAYASTMRFAHSIRSQMTSSFRASRKMWGLLNRNSD